MSRPPLLVMGYSEAGMLLARRDPAPVGAVIAIRGGRDFAVESDVPHRLELHFDDEASPDAADSVAAYRAYARRRWAAENGLVLTPPTREDAEAVIQFAHRIRDMDGALLCQCSAGVSRSPAVALLCLAAWEGPGRERLCVEELLRVRPCAFPHPDLIRFGDAILGRNGRLVEALQEIDRAKALDEQPVR
jgi:predicted protein tyrosine phosphatase